MPLSAVEALLGGLPRVTRASRTGLLVVKTLDKLPGPPGRKVCGFMVHAAAELPNGSSDSNTKIAMNSTSSSVSLRNR